MTERFEKENLLIKYKKIVWLALFKEPLLPAKGIYHISTVINMWLIFRCTLPLYKCTT